MTSDSEISAPRSEAGNAVRTTARVDGGDEANRLVRLSPPPLILPNARLIVVFSPKSACTSVVIWFLHHLGEMQRARAYHPWPHRYRIDIYYRSAGYRDAVSGDLTGFKLLRVARDPFDRAVSSFRHALRFGVADRDFAALMDRKDVAEAGVSFRDFLDLLERLNLRTCNEHFRLQRHPVEDALPVSHFINVSREDLFARLNQVESDIGLPVTDFDELKWMHRLQANRSRSERDVFTIDAYALPFTRVQARDGPWPSYDALLTPAARERIARLYAADIAAYGFSTEAEAQRPSVAPRPLLVPTNTAPPQDEETDDERRAARKRRRERRARRRRGAAQRDPEGGAERTKNGS